MQAYDEYLTKSISAGKDYEQLPPRIQTILSYNDWVLKVKEAYVSKGLAWVGLVKGCCSEEEYYQQLLKKYRDWARLFPYHLSEYIARIQRTTAFKYYSDVLANMLKEDKAYDRLPNFTAADIVQCLGVGRNEYIAMHNQVKGRRLMWRLNPKGLAKEVLPTQPIIPPPHLDPWWTVSVVNLTEAEFRELDEIEVATLKTASLPRGEPSAVNGTSGAGGTRVSDLDHGVIVDLYRRGLCYFEVPVLPDDKFSIPPLEGFVSNREQQHGSQAADPIESILYSAFVASSENLRVADLAEILQLPTFQVQMAMSIAVRLGFAKKVSSSNPPISTTSSFASLPPREGLASKQATVAAASTSSGGNLIDLDSEESIGVRGDPASLSGLFSESSSFKISNNDFPLSPLPSLNPKIDLGSSTSITASVVAGGGRAVALLLDAEATSYLMMGALCPGLKRHSVTLFEGGRVGGEAVITELISELWESYEAGQKFEGDMLRLTLFVGAMATALETLKRSSGGRPLELLRKESLAGLTPSAARKVLFHAYAAVVPACPLPGPPLPLLFSPPPHKSQERGPGSIPPPPPPIQQPAYYGPIGEATSPWLQLLLYSEAKAGPPSLVLVKGQRISTLPDLLEGCTHALVWPWHQASPQNHHGGGGGGGSGGNAGCWGAAASAAASEGSPFVLVDSTFLLFMLNEALEQTAVMVQPIDGPRLLDLASNLLASRGHGLSATEEDHSVELEDPFLLVDVPLPLQPTETRHQLGHQSAAGSEPSFQAIERHPSGAPPRAMDLQLDATVREAIGGLGLDGCPGVLRMILWPSPASDRRYPIWLPLSLSIGFPLYCLPLCQAVCANSELSGFLNDVGRERRGWRQDQMMEKLMDLIEEHQGGKLWMGAEPSVNLAFDSKLGLRSMGAV